MTLNLSFDERLGLLEAGAGTFNELTIDTEGYPHHMLGVSASFDGLGFGLYFPVGHEADNMSPVQTKKLLSIVEGTDLLNFHNAPYDLRVLAGAGCSYKNAFNDTLLMSHWINEEEFSYSLDAMCRKYGIPLKEKSKRMQTTITDFGWLAIPVSMIEHYAAHDAFITNELKNKVVPLYYQQFTEELWATEQVFVRDVIVPMMDRGIKVDLDFVTKEYMRGENIQLACCDELGFKISLTSKLTDFMLNDLKLPVVKHTKSCKKCYPDDKTAPREKASQHDGKPSFDKEAMEAYDEIMAASSDTRAQTILRYKGWQKTNSSNYMPYMRLVDNEHNLHPGYKLHGTKTGRLSCAEPNLQQIPKSSGKDWNGNLKKAFIPREGFGLWSIDYSQLQFRMTVAYAGQHDLIEIFNDPTRDIFTEMATQMGWERQDVKTLVYLILFGGGANRASEAFGVTLSVGAELVSEFHNAYPNIKKIAKEAEQTAKKLGYVKYWTGRRRHFGYRGAPTYRAFNAVIQGGEAEIMKRAMLALVGEVCDEHCRLVLQIHDEIVLEITEGMEDIYLPRVQKVMEAAPNEFCKFVGVDVAFKTSAGKWGAK